MDQLKKQKELEDYKKEIDEKSLEEVLEIEKQLVEEADKINVKITSYEFKLPTKGYKELAEAIRYFLNKQEASWQYTVGLITMYEFWDPTKNPKKVLYQMFDGTLRYLGDMKFKGYDEWKMVVLINDFFKDLREEYATLTEEIYDNASKHNILIERIELLDPSKSNNEGGAVSPEL